MPKRDKRKSKHSRSKTKYDEWEEQGRGTGTGPDYISGIFIDEVPSSRGNQKSSVPGIKAKGRPVQLMSALEFMIFLFFDLAKQVIDTRDQYYLDRAITLAIAEKLNIKHPSIPDAQTGEQIAHWMTTDLLIDYYDKRNERQQLAVYIKPAEDLKGSNLDKLIIEYIYWSLKGVRFCIITDECIPTEIAENISFVKLFYENDTFIKELQPKLSQIETFILNEIKNEYLEINNLCKKLDQDKGFTPGSCLTIFYYMVAARKIDLPLKRFSIGPNTHSSEIRRYLN